MNAVILLLVLVVEVSRADIYFVSEGNSIGGAVEGALPGDTIILEDGLHIGPVVPYGKRLVIGSAYILDGDSAHIQNTIVRPNDAIPDSFSCAIFAHGEPLGSRLIGLTLQDGAGTWWEYAQAYAGGGIYIHTSSVAIENCVIKDCNAPFGGAIAVLAWEYQWNATLRLIKCNLSDCRSSLYGGGIYADNCSLVVSKTVFDSLTCEIGEGAISAALVRVYVDSCVVQRCCGGIGGIGFIEAFGSISNSHFRLNSVCQVIGECDLRLGSFWGTASRNVFTENRSGLPSVSISGNYSDAHFISNVLEGNETSIATGTLVVDDPVDTDVAFNIFRDNMNVYGGAVYCFSRSLARIHHNTFTNNSSLNPEGGSAIQTMSFGRPDVFENIIAGNSGQTISAYYQYPVRIDARNNWWGHESGPYHPTLNPTGQGDTLLSDSVTFIPWLTSPPDTTQPTAIRPEPALPIAGTWDLQAVFPNPFNNAFTLSLAGFTGNAFRLAMHNVLGQEVAELYSGAMHGGSYSFTVSAELASGIYFIVAHDDLVTESIKVVLLK